MSRQVTVVGLTVSGGVVNARNGNLDEDPDDRQVIRMI